MSAEAKKSVLIIGGGPAGLFAAEHLSASGHAVTVIDRMPTVARKLLMAGRGGLNLTHAEGLKDFLTRYGANAAPIVSAIHGFRPRELMAWADGLGAQTFEGTSGRVFPRAMKASPLLRAWLQRLETQGVTIVTSERWTGWNASGAATFRNEVTNVESTRAADATLLSLGGASWPRLGSDAAWVPLIVGLGIELTPFQPSNAGVRIAWSRFLIDKFAGTPLKRLGISVGGIGVQSEAIVTRAGLEGGAIYTIGAALREAMAMSGGSATLTLDLKPGQTSEELARNLSKPRGKQTLANHLRKTIGLPPVMIALLHEVHGKALPAQPEALAAAIKALPLKVEGFSGLERAISSAGGIALTEINQHFMLTKKPGVFVAGEMLDWDAPTGGYLLQATFATAKAAAQGMALWLKDNPTN